MDLTEKSSWLVELSRARRADAMNPPNWLVPPDVPSTQRIATWSRITATVRRALSIGSASSSSSAVICTGPGFWKGMNRETVADEPGGIVGMVLVSALMLLVCPRTMTLVAGEVP